MLNLLFQVLLLIVKSVAGFFCVLLLVRFYMQVFRVSFADRFGSFVVQLTNWLVLPLRKVIPGVFGLDLSSLLPAYLLQVIVLFAAVALQAGPDVPVVVILFGALRALLRTSIYLLIGLLILQAVLSWVNPYSPISRPINQITQVFLGPIRRIVPPIANIDLSPLVAILLAQVILIFI